MTERLILWTECVTIHWKAVEQYSTLVLFVFQFNPVCTFGKFNNFGLGILASEMVKQSCLNPLSPSIKLQFLLLCFHAFFTEVVGRSC